MKFNGYNRHFKQIKNVKNKEVGLAHGSDNTLKNVAGHKIYSLVNILGHSGAWLSNNKKVVGVAGQLILNKGSIFGPAETFTLPGLELFKR